MGDAIDDFERDLLNSVACSTADGIAEAEADGRVAESVSRLSRWDRWSISFGG